MYLSLIHILGYLSLADTPKPDAVQAIRELKDLNINNIQILSGDKQTCLLYTSLPNMVTLMM